VTAPPHLPTHDDLQREPAPLVCGSTGRSDDERGCGRQWRWEWYTPTTRSGEKHPPRWCAPKVSPCRECAPSPESQAEHELLSRLAHAGIPEPLRRYSLDQVLLQKSDEPIETFRTRVLRDGRLGVALVNAGALARIRSWQPRDEHGRARWLVLHGAPGTGKTTLLAALARKLLASPAERWTNKDGGGRVSFAGQRTLHRARVHGAIYERTDELVRREQLKARVIDPHPMRDAALEPRVLLLDELGCAERPPQSEVDLIERVLTHRHDYGMVTVIATNRSWEELTDASRGIYGWRVADRLRAATEVEIGGPSWRGP
jgi:DNA replication protein DnaC